MRLKKYFYILRSVLALRWIESHKNMPPMAFSDLVAACVSQKDVLAEINTLLEIKNRGKESLYGVRRPAIDTLIQEIIDSMERYQFPEPSCRDSRLLDAFLQKTILEFSAK